MARTEVSEHADWFGSLTACTLEPNQAIYFGEPFNRFVFGTEPEPTFLILPLEYIKELRFRSNERFPFNFGAKTSGMRKNLQGLL